MVAACCAVNMANLGIEKLKRVMWRLEALNKPVITRVDLKRAIMLECGISPKTFRSNRDALLFLKWIVRYKKLFKVSGKHLTDDA